MFARGLITMVSGPDKPSPSSPLTQNGSTWAPTRYLSTMFSLVLKANFLNKSQLTPKIYKARWPTGFTRSLPTKCITFLTKYGDGWDGMTAPTSCSPIRVKLDGCTFPIADGTLMQQVSTLQSTFIITTCTVTPTYSHEKHVVLRALPMVNSWKETNSASRTDPIFKQSIF